MSIEVASISVMVKALDFLFEEGKMILEERRERRKAQRGAEKPKTEVATSPSAGVSEIAEVIQSREVALRTSIAESAWRDSEAQVKHLLSLLEIHSQNYRLFKEQKAKYTSLAVPTHILHGLTEVEDEVAKATKELQAVLSKIYGKRVIVPEVEIE